MTGLLLVVSDAHGERFRAAVEVAAVTAALGRPVAVLLRGAAAGMARNMPVDNSLALLLEMQVELVVCQTALDAQGLRADELVDGVTAGGLIAFLAGRENWQMLLV